MWLFEVSVFGKALLEKLVGQDASLWETIHPLAHLHVDVTFQCFVKEAVVVDDVVVVAVAVAGCGHGNDKGSSISSSGSSFGG